MDWRVVLLKDGVASTEEVASKEQHWFFEDFQVLIDLYVPFAWIEFAKACSAEASPGHHSSVLDRVLKQIRVVALTVSSQPTPTLTDERSDSYP